MEVKSKKFIDELNNREPNAKMFEADRDLESLMAMRDRRARKHGISIKEYFAEPTGQDANKQPDTTTYRDDRYLVAHEAIPMSHKITFTKDNRTLYRHESNRVDVIADVIDLLDPAKLPAEAYICPNCGDISSAEELASTGCPYCGTHFSIPQLFPKVSHFSYTENNSEKTQSGVRKSLKPTIITFLIAYVIFFGRSCWAILSDGGEIGSIGLVGFLMIIAAAVPALICFGISMYINTIKTAVSDKYQHFSKIRADRDTAISTTVFEKAMEKYGPVFNFNYFSSRVYNLLGAMIYAENKNECPFYNGPDFIGAFDAIIDYVPIGLEILKFDIDDNGKCTIEATILADTYSYDNGRILHRKAEFHVRTSKNMNYPIDINFSAHTYKCDGCGASFDVIKTQTCPYCGRPHDMLDEEWYIDGGVRGFFK